MYYSPVTLVAAPAPLANYTTRWHSTSQKVCPLLLQLRNAEGPCSVSWCCTCLKPAVFVSRKVIQWCTHHKDDPPPPEDDENKEKRTDDIPVWDQEFLKVDQGTLFELILVWTACCDNDSLALKTLFAVFCFWILFVWLLHFQRMLTNLNEDSDL